VRLERTSFRAGDAQFQVHGIFRIDRPGAESQPDAQFLGRFGGIGGRTAGPRVVTEIVGLLAPAFFDEGGRPKGPRKAASSSFVWCEVSLAVRSAFVFGRGAARWKTDPELAIASLADVVGTIVAR